MTLVRCREHGTVIESRPDPAWCGALGQCAVGDPCTFEHVGDPVDDELYASKAAARLDATINRAFSTSTAYWKSVALRDATASEPLTLEKLQAAIKEIWAPRVPEIEQRGNIIYVDGVPTYELNAPIVTRSWEWIPATREILFPSPLQMAIREHAEHILARQLAERRNRIDTSC